MVDAPPQPEGWGFSPAVTGWSLSFSEKTAGRQAKACPTGEEIRPRAMNCAAPSQDSADFSPRCGASAVQRHPGEAAGLLEEEGVRHLQVLKVGLQPDSDRLKPVLLGEDCRATG